jgi:hypothetical protein
MSQFDFNKYCTPAQVYLFLAVIGLISGFLKNFRVFTLIFNAIFVVLFAWILNFMCSNGLTPLSWGLVLLPFVLLASSFFMALEAQDQKTQEIYEGMHSDGDPMPSDEVLTDPERFKAWCVEHPKHEMCLSGGDE